MICCALAPAGAALRHVAFYILALCAASRVSAELLPIFFMHGLNGGHERFDKMQEWIRQRDPDATTYSFPIAEHEGSTLNLWAQGDHLMEQLRAKTAAQPSIYADGYVLVCHSQGALLCRTVVERMDDHNVHTLIALAGPQNGIFGVPPDYSKFLPYPRDEVYHAAYTAAMQDKMSVANYWHDPRPTSGLFHPVQDYWSSNTFLPVFNNDPGRKTQGYHQAKNDTEAARYKSNFLRLNAAVFTCGTADRIVVPYDSGIFNFYDPWPSKGSVILEQTAMWEDDWIGLRTLAEGGRLTRITAPGVTHNG